MRAKIAISLPPKTFAQLERRRRQTKKSRSAIVAEALEAFFAGTVLGDEERRYVAGYLAQPEDSREATAIVLASAWGDWDEA